MKKILYPIIPLIFLAELFCIKSIPVVKETFPLEKIEAVMFTLTQNIDGSQKYVINIILGIFKSSLIIFVVIAVVTTFILFTTHKLHSNHILKNKNFPTFLQISSFTTIVAFVVLVYRLFTQLPIFDFVNEWSEINALPERSKFYQKEYVDPNSVEINFTKKQNLILIFLESMEYNYQDFTNGGNLKENLIPEITDYLQNEQSFFPGGAPAYGMGWTMADAVAKTCGVPLLIPPTIEHSFTRMEAFLPGATCLTDVLAKEGYNFVVTKGANLKFSGMDDFLKTHSNPQAFGFIEYLKDPRVNEENISKWGVRDSLHYEIVKEHISQLNKKNKPWGIWMFTVDTHTPYGFVDPSCSVPKAISEREQLPYVIKCASRQVDNFIKWAKTQEWFNHTTIAVMGDHASMSDPTAAGFSEMDITHYWLNFFINSVKQSSQRNRAFTSMDFFPTILESMGANIANGALGFGRSLYASSPTLLEKYGSNALDSALKKRSLEYNTLLYGKK